MHEIAESLNTIAYCGLIAVCVPFVYRVIRGVLVIAVIRAIATAIVASNKTPEKSREIE